MPLHRRSVAAGRGTSKVLAYSKAAIPMLFSPSFDALSAAWLTRLYSSAPEKPGVPRASCSMSTSADNGTW